MPVFYFVLDDNGTITNDDDGIELESPQVAYDEAVIALTEMSTEFKPEDGKRILRMIVLDSGRGVIGSPEVTYDPTNLFALKR